MLGWLVAVLVPLAYLLGVLSALDAVMKTRTAQGATAWVLGLVAMPFVALPLYWVFGRAKFDDYLQRVRDFDRTMEARWQELQQRGDLDEWLVAGDPDADLRTRGELRAFRNLATTPFTRGNSLRLLVDGKAKFDALFAALDEARDYVLAQYYILRDDETGRCFRDRLLAAAARGVRVYLLYDEVGTARLSSVYINSLRDAGIRVSAFSGHRSWLGRFRLNFRNHRKIVVIDGDRGFMGGLNVGDEYLGRDPRMGAWRDTHLEVAGPVVQGLQLSFLRDWHYGRRETIEVGWRPSAHEDDQRALVLASGPADQLETCGLLFTHTIESAERRVWIASPYFVPDGRVLGALQLAALRGVDVRVLMPRKTDNAVFRYVPYAYLPEAEQAGVKIYLYEPGFMHQKVLLVDDDYAAVGTANLDNRSFRLNFEVTLLAQDRGFCSEVEAMLERDFERATLLEHDQLADRPFYFRFAAQATRLLAPVL